MKYTTLFMALLLGSSVQAATTGWQSSLLTTGSSQRSDVTDSAQSQDALSSEARLQWMGPLTGPVSGVLDVRGFVSNKNTALRDSESSLAAASSSEHYLALRQLGAVWQPLGWTGFPGESLSAGLLRRRSENAGWWDSNLESLGWQLDTTTTQALLAVGEQFKAWRSGGQLATYDKDKLRVFGEWVQDWQPDYAWSARFMFARQSGVTEPSAIENPQGLNGHWLWLGLGVRHAWFGRQTVPDDRLAWLLEWTGLRGSADLQDATGSRINDASIKAWMVEGGLRYDWYLPAHVALGTHYLYGSGGVGDHSSNNFVQTGLQSNLQSFWGNRQSLFQFNDVLHADPSNLTRWGLFAVWDPHPDLETGLMWSWMYRNDTAVPVYADGAPLSMVADGSKSVGQGLDVVGAWYFHSVLDWQTEGRLRLRGSAFETGSAFVQAHEWEHRVALDLLIGF